MKLTQNFWRRELGADNEAQTRAEGVRFAPPDVAAWQSHGRARAGPGCQSCVMMASLGFTVCINSQMTR